jgi:lysophospholipid acyltransferase 5
VQYATLLVFGKTWISPAFSMVFQTVYLLFGKKLQTFLNNVKKSAMWILLIAGYWHTASEKYDISWTLPHCVLTLRLIGIAFDYYDGQQNPAHLSKDQLIVCLKRCPTLLELLGHVYFPATFMVGPQFPMKRYKFLIKGELKLSPPLHLVAIRLGLGLVYTFLYVIGGKYLPVDYVVSDDFLARPLYQRLALLAVWAKINIMKYLGCWLITEGACILAGLSFNGLDEKGEAKWDGCRNVHISIYETATEYQHMILCFNTNTNAWVAK